MHGQHEECVCSLVVALTFQSGLWPPTSPLPADPLVGRHEVLGVRRSCRAPQEPLKWWLNEKKEFGREHQ